MIRVFLLNELTLLRFVLSAILGRKPYVALIQPHVTWLRGPLTRLAAAMKRRGWAGDLLDLFPSYRHVIEQPATIYIFNIFEETEPWLLDFYRMSEADQPLSEYGRPIRQEITKFPVPYYLPILLVDESLKRYGADGIRLFGAPRDLTGLYEAYFGRPVPATTAPPAWSPTAAANAFQWVAATVGSVLWILSRLRLRVRPTAFFLAADYIGDPRDIRLYEELREGGPLLLVERSPAFKAAANPATAAYSHCRPRDGRFDVASALSAIRMVVADCWHLYRHHREKAPPLFYRIVMLPLRRAILRAFLTRFRPHHFWGRDDYNVEHILRRQELNRIGAKSLGIMHGCPGVSILEPMWRYISFDTYFIFGRAVYDEYWKDTFAQDMAIHPIGTFGATREDYARIGEPLPDNIIVFTSVFSDSEKLPPIVRQLAEAFPKRNIILSPKRSVLHLESTKRIVAACREGLPNVTVETGEVNLFERFRHARYAFSDSSTTIAESIQFGLYSFFLDLSDRQRACSYRGYPALCIADGAMAAQRIREIEAGAWAYPRESFGGIVSLSGEIFFDAVREAVGLPAKEPAIPIMTRLQRQSGEQAVLRETV